ncbi:MAG: Na+/H+ antiporter NhaC family protein [Succinivibrionaceae bacterium]|nr:Na+/H+ antiporter NhaC family protein [Succinivibrionaceae bacterium]
MEPYYAGALSILPPIIAVILALITKEVFISLVLGILSGTFIYSMGMDGNALTDPLRFAVAEMVHKFDLNIVVFCSLLGSLVYVISMAGGAQAYGRWATRSIKSRSASMISTSVLGAFIFIDDYFNCLTVGTVMRPITDAYRISRAKLAYIIDATAAPICIIAPISSWAAAVGSNLKDTKAFDSEMGAFIATIPWNFYALLSILMVLYVAFRNPDFGPMRRTEVACLSGSHSEASDHAATGDIKVEADGKVYDMVVPILALILITFLNMLNFGGYFGDDPAFHSIGAAMGNTDVNLSLVLGSFMALIVAFFLFVPRGLLSIKSFMQGALRGVQAMVPANLILTLAWTISGVCRDLLQTPQFISTLITPDMQILGMVLPAIIFAIAGFLSFATGTAWGTFGIMIPIVVTVAQGIDPTGESSLVVITLSATLAGSVFGDHCSPISDTTVLSSAGSGCDHFVHVTTQMPYACVVAFSAICGYLVAGLTGGNNLISFVAALAVLLGMVTLLNQLARSRDGAALERELRQGA